MRAFTLLALAALFTALYVRRRVRALRRASSVAEEGSFSHPLPHGLPIEKVAAFLAERDAREAPLKPGCGSSIGWAPSVGADNRAHLCVVSLHGWSASPMEVADLDKRVADGLGAHLLLRVRLTAHGLEPADRASVALSCATSRATLQRDAAIAIALGTTLADRVVVLGCSTGATLAMWAAAQPWTAGQLAALVLVSPGFEIALKGPIAYQIFKWLVLLLPHLLVVAALRLFVGGRREFHIRPPTVEAHRGVQRAYWTDRYVVESARHVVELYAMLEFAVAPSQVATPTLAFACPRDPAVSFDATARWIRAMPHAELEVVHDAEHLHCLAGALAPATCEPFARRAIAFLQARACVHAADGVQMCRSARRRDPISPSRRR